MKTNIEEKQDELIEHYKAYHDSTKSPAVKIPDYNKWNEYGKTLESELAALKFQEEEMEREDLINLFKDVVCNVGQYGYLTNDVSDRIKKVIQSASVNNCPECGYYKSHVRGCQRDNRELIKSQSVADEEIYTYSDMVDCFHAGFKFSRDMVNNPSNSEYIMALRGSKI